MSMQELICVQVMPLVLVLVVLLPSTLVQVLQEGTSLSRVVPLLKSRLVLCWLLEALVKVPLLVGLLLWMLDLPPVVLLLVAHSLWEVVTPLRVKALVVQLVSMLGPLWTVVLVDL
jgi:hypothetical protein